MNKEDEITYDDKIKIQRLFQNVEDKYNDVIEPAEQLVQKMNTIIKQKETKEQKRLEKLAQKKEAAKKEINNEK